MTTTRVSRGVPSGGQFTHGQHAAPTVTLPTANRYSHITTVDRLDEQYEFSISPEMLSHDGERSLAQQRRAAADLSRDYQERRVQLVAADKAFHEAMDLTTLEVGKPRSIPASTHRQPGADQIVLTNKGPLSKGSNLNVIAIDYHLTGHEELADLRDGGENRPAAIGAAEKTLEEILEVDTPTWYASARDQKFVLTQHETYRAGDKMDGSDLIDWAQSLHRDAQKNRSKVENTFNHHYETWDQD